MAIVQQLDRVQHATSSGMEITRQFYVEPYSAFQEVVFRLQGSVVGGARRPPMRDPYVRNAYCNETLVSYADKRVAASSDALSKDVGDDTTKQLEAKQEPAEGLAGALITAHYRPIVTAWKSSDPTEPDDQQWDWVDPKFKPGVRMIPWPAGLFIRTEALVTRGIPSESSSPIAVAIHDFTIKRLFLSEIPWGAIAAAKGTINQGVFPRAGHETNGQLPVFIHNTLKFEGAETTNMMDTAGNRWYEVLYHFKWIQQPAGVLINAAGDEVIGDPWVTWNHVFMNPSIFGLQGRTAWYEVFRGQATEIPFLKIFGINIPFLAVEGGPLFNQADFMGLFE
jgi:hypothetical protein